MTDENLKDMFQAISAKKYVDAMKAILKQGDADLFHQFCGQIFQANYDVYVFSEKLDLQDNYTLDSYDPKLLAELITQYDIGLSDEGLADLTGYALTKSDENLANACYRKMSPQARHQGHNIRSDYYGPLAIVAAQNNLSDFAAMIMQQNGFDPNERLPNHDRRNETEPVSYHVVPTIAALEPTRVGQLTKLLEGRDIQFENQDFIDLCAIKSDAWDEYIITNMVDSGLDEFDHQYLLIAAAEHNRTAIAQFYMDNPALIMEGAEDIGSLKSDMDLASSVTDATVNGGSREVLNLLVEKQWPIGDLDHIQAECCRFAKIRERAGRIVIKRDVEKAIQEMRFPQRA